MAKKAQEKEERMLRIRKQFKSANDYWDENRTAALKDIKFRDGDQWPEKDKKQREEEGRPCLTFNRCEGFIDQVVGDARQNKIDIKITAIDKSPGAKIYEALIQEIEYKSKAHIAYNTALDHAAGSGFGWIRVATKYVDGTFDQECEIKRVINQFTVYPGPAKELTKYDMPWCFVSSYLEKDEFEEKYPDASSEPAGKGETYENWFGDRVRISEYFEKRPITKTLVLLSNNQVVEKTADIPKEMIVKEREETSYEVYRSLISGNEELEPPKKIPGKYIPLIFVPGKELHIEGKTKYRGVIRYAIDAMIAYNYHRSASAETVGLAPKAPWLATSDQIEGYEGIWSTANSKTHNYLPYNHKPGQPMPQRVMPSQVNSGAVNEAMMAAEDLKATTGIYDASLGAKGNETSGKAILARQREGDTATFAYHDNLAIAIEQVGRVLVSMIPEVYDGERDLPITRDGQTSTVPLNKRVNDRGNMATINDLTIGSYEVAVTTGASYTTQRVEARDTLMQLVQVSPRLQDVALDKIFDNMDFKGADEIAERLRPSDPNKPNAQQQLEMEKSKAEQAKYASVTKQAEADIAMAAAKEAEAKYKFAAIGEPQRVS